MKLIAMGGKGPSNTAVGVAVDANGNLKTKKTWENDAITLMSSEEIRDTNAHTTVSTVCDCSDCAMVSLRITNTLKDSEDNRVNIEVRFLNDKDSTDTGWPVYLDGTEMKFTCGTGTRPVMPEDVPFLKYVKFLKLRVQASATPASGSVTIVAYRKR